MEVCRAISFLEYLQMPNLFRRSTKRISLLDPQTPQMSYIQSQGFRKISNSKPGFIGPDDQKNQKADIKTFNKGHYITNTKNALL